MYCPDDVMQHKCASIGSIGDAVMLHTCAIIGSLGADVMQPKCDIIDTNLLVMKRSCDQSRPMGDYWHDYWHDYCHNLWTVSE